MGSTGAQLVAPARRLEDVDSGGRKRERAPERGGDPVRVLHVITRMILGGAQENTLLSVEGLARLDRYQVALVSGVDEGREGELLSRARETTSLIVVPELARNISPLADLKALVSLYRIIRSGAITSSTPTPPGSVFLAGYGLA
jgi:hypothetical protein